ncbi:uncharacterized protein [Apostichopus japonicus]|uniref:uncharacterized protein isoform X2 n=1 Tax=Stichopus japonicus TaxID=307972 RepID=UPI003AB61D19
MTSKLEWMVFLLMTNFIYQSSQEEIMETLKNCSRPPQIEGVAQFIQIGEKWIELNETDQESFEVGTTVSFQCQSPGLEVLEGMPENTCSSGGQWPEVPTSCLGVEEKLTITPNLPLKVQHDGSITVFLPPDRNVTITCQLRRPREPDLLFKHIQQEEGRAVAFPVRGDSIHPEKYLTLSPANESDSGEFVCTDMDRTNSHPLTIQFENLLVEGCPVNVTKQTDQGMNDTEVRWDLPIFHADVIAEITANFNSGDRFQIGVYTVNITAATGSGTFDVCTFHVNIVAGLPRAYRNCTFYQRLGGLWSAGAEVTDCGLPRNNVTLQELKDYPVDEFTAEDVALSLSDIVSRLNVTRLDDTDVILIADIIDEIVETRVPSQNILESILATVEMVYLTENEISIAGEKSQVSTRITLALEQQVTTLSKSGMELTIETESIVVRTATVENSSASIGKTAFEIKPVHHSASMPGSSAGIPTVKLPLEEIHRTVNASLTDPIEALHLGFIYYENPVLFVQAEIGARSRNPLLKGNVTGGIISASVGDLTIQGLRQSVEIVFPLNSSENLSSLPAQCVFWDFNLGANGGGWSNKGCWLVEQTNEFIVCHSDHLTHFAVLMDFTGHGGESAALDILTKIGCVLSIAGLLITVITFVAFRTLRNSRHRQILINHCISLLLLYIVFLAGIDSNISFVCMASAILLHYFMLTTMFWMAVEAHNMYMYLVKVFQRDVRRFILKASILAWGVPLLITTASVLSSYEQYKSEEYCFPNPGINLYLSLLLPICLVMVHNFVIFSMVVCRLVFTDVAGKAVTRSRKQQLVTRLQNAMCMSVLMGLSWSLGFLVVAHPTFIFQLLFCIVNSLQGLAVFILFCVRVSDVRTAYKTCMPWLDVELNIRGQSYKVQERSIHHNRGLYLNGDDPLWLVNSDKVVNALSWPSDTPGLEGYMHLQFERQLSSNTDTTRVS